MSRVTLRAPGLVAGFILVFSATLAACGGEEAPRIDAQLSVEMPASVPLDEPLHITYTWSPGDEFAPPMEDYQVFVHVNDAQGNTVFQDDHYPTEPTSQWSQGEPQIYERWTYLPAGMEVDQLEFVVGLYSPDGRAQLRGDAGTWTNEVAAHSLEVRLDDMSGVPAYIEGWHEREGLEVGNREWRWTEGVARAAFTNPRRDAILHLTAHAPFDEVGPQVLVLRVGEAEIGRIEIDSAQEIGERLQVPAAVMGDDDWVELSLEISPVLVPKDLDPDSADERTLGVQVFQLYLSSS